MPEFSYTDLLPTGPDDTEYRLLTSSTGSPCARPSAESSSRSSPAS